MSQYGDLTEAVRGLSSPQFIMLFSNKDQFDSHVRELEKLFPGVPSIGCVGMCYDTRVVPYSHPRYLQPTKSPDSSAPNKSSSAHRRHFPHKNQNNVL